MASINPRECGRFLGCRQLRYPAFPLSAQWEVPDEPAYLAGVRRRGGRDPRFRSTARPAGSRLRRAQPYGVRRAGDGGELRDLPRHAWAPRAGLGAAGARRAPGTGARRGAARLQGRQARGDRDAADREGLLGRRDRGAGRVFRAPATLGRQEASMSMRRREFLGAGAAGLAAAVAGCAGMPGAAAPKARVAVIGGGFGGATAAKYVRLLDSAIDVVLVEPGATFVSCPVSNMVLGGFRNMADITIPYSGLARHGVRLVRDSATAIDLVRKEVRLAARDPIRFDRVVVSPGVDFLWEALASMTSAEPRSRVLHAWKAGAQTLELRRRLEAMPDGGGYVLSIPEAPYRCPPGPYERACQVAAYFKARKPRSKVLVLDANQDVTSKGPLFKKAWAELYKDLIEYRPNSKAIDVDWRAGTVKLEFGDVKGDVLNVLPPMKAGDIAAA